MPRQACDTAGSQRGFPFLSYAVASVQLGSILEVYDCADAVVPVISNYSARPLHKADLSKSILSKRYIFGQVGGFDAVSFGPGSDLFARSACKVLMAYAKLDPAAKVLL
jgi:hypothetical protein